MLEHLVLGRLEDRRDHLDGRSFGGDKVVVGPDKVVVGTDKVVV